MRFVSILLALSVFLACAGRAERRLDPREKRLAAAYAELFKLSRRVSPREPAYQDSAEAVLNKLHFPREEYDRAVASLNRKPERWELFYIEVQKLASMDLKNPPPRTNSR
jgi:hypothetical protein